jgi:hypothetical protein
MYITFIPHESAYPSKYSGGRAVGKIILSEAGTTVYQVIAEDRKFNVTVIGEGIKSLTFSQEEKNIVLENDGRVGSIEIAIPKELLDGDFTVRIDGEQVDFDLSQTEAYSVLLINRPSETEKISIEGTTVIPEFYVTYFVLAAIMALAILIAKTKINYIFRF